MVWINPFDEMRRMQQEIDRQCRNFDLLLKDIQEGHLKPGIQRKEFIRIYGEPILEEEMDGRTELLYRYPLEFFASQKVYVYFDKNGYLLEWRVEI